MKLSTILAIGLLAVPTAKAQMAADMKMPPSTVAPAASAGASAALTHGVVQQVDRSTGTVTLQHENIANMKMPAMTMAFGVADKKLLDHVNAGDKVGFRVEMFKGAPTVMRIEPTP